MKSFYSKKLKTCVRACKGNPELEIVHLTHDPISSRISGSLAYTHARRFFAYSPVFFRFSDMRGNGVYSLSMKFCFAKWNNATHYEIVLRNMKWNSFLKYAKHISYAKRISYAEGIFHSFLQEWISLKKPRFTTRFFLAEKEGFAFSAEKQGRLWQSTGLSFTTGPFESLLRTIKQNAVLGCCTHILHFERRRRDSNPRTLLHVTRFPVVRPRPSSKTVHFTEKNRSAEQSG